MLLSLLWDEIVADDIMFSVKVMKLLIWNVLLKLNSKSYHVVKEKRIIHDAILKTRHERNWKIFFFFSPCLVLMRRGLARRKKTSCENFKSWISLLLSTNIVLSCEECFGGEDFKVGTFLSTVLMQKNSWIDQIWTKFATGSEMVFFFPMYYLQKQSQQFKERTRCWPCFGHSFLLSSLLRSHLRLWFATRMI